VEVGVDVVPMEVLQFAKDVKIAIDIMFVKKIAFIITLSHKIKFGTVESLPNRQSTTIKNCLRK
jgi:hypothetical protein